MVEQYLNDIVMLKDPYYTKYENVNVHTKWKDNWKYTSNMLLQIYLPTIESTIKKYNTDIEERCDCVITYLLNWQDMSYIDKTHYVYLFISHFMNYYDVQFSVFIGNNVLHASLEGCRKTVSGSFVFVTRCRNVYPHCH